MIQEENKDPIEIPSEPTKEQLLEALDNFYQNIDKLPLDGQFSYCTNADIAYVAALIAKIFRSQ